MPTAALAIRQSACDSVTPRVACSRRQWLALVPSVMNEVTLQELTTLDQLVAP